MELKKRGLSDVVTVTLIILLAVEAVVIVWAFVRSTLEQAGEEITLTCVTANLKAVSCVAASGAVVVRNDATDGIVESVKVITYDASGTSTITAGSCDTTSIDPLEQATCTPANPVLVTQAVVAPVIDGKTYPPS